MLSLGNERRLERDIRERGRTPESVFRQFRETVQPMAALHVHPTSSFADVVLDGTAPLEASVERLLAYLRLSPPPSPAGRC